MRTTDLSSNKILDRSAPVTSVAVDNSGSEEGLMALVFDEIRVVIYDSLQKEVKRKHRVP